MRVNINTWVALHSGFSLQVVLYVLWCSVVVMNDTAWPWPGVLSYSCGVGKTAAVEGDVRTGRNSETNQNRRKLIKMERCGSTLVWPCSLFYSDFSRKSIWIQQNELEQNLIEYIHQELFKSGFEISWIHEVGVSADYDELKTETEEELMGEAGWASTVSLTVSWQVQ